MSGVNEIRSKFLDYFAGNGHTAVPSSPRAAQPAAARQAPKETAQARKERLKSEGLEVFAMIRYRFM